MPASRFRYVPPSGVSHATTEQNNREQAEMSTLGGEGVARTTRGTFKRRNLRFMRAPTVTFSGNVYVAGNAFTGFNSDASKPYVRVVLGASTTIEESAGPMPNPFPANEEWYEKQYTYGDIHVTRFG